MFNKNFAKYLTNIYHMFNIFLPKPYEIFAKSLSNLQQKFDSITDPMVYSTNTILAMLAE